MRLLTHLAAVAAGLAAARAFLLVPEVSETDVVDAIKALPFEQAATVEKQTVELSCPGCPLSFEDRYGQVKVKTGKKSHLELSFAIDHQGPSDRLLVNDFELYPNSAILDHILTAPHKPDCSRKNKWKKNKQVDGREAKKHGGNRKHKFISEPLGFALHVNQLTKSLADGMELISVHLQIFEVANTFVDGVPEVYITLIQTAKGELGIGEVNVTPSQMGPTPSGSKKVLDCDNFLCKWRAAIEDKVAKIKPFFKGCAGKANGKPNAAVDGEAWDGHYHHFGDHHKAHKHSWSQLFKSITAHIVLPILIGIIAGVTVSLIGMMVGTFIVALWRTFFRRHRHAGHAHHRAARKEAAAAEEKASLMKQQEAPPAYEEADLKKPDA